LATCDLIKSPKVIKVVMQRIKFWLAGAWVLTEENLAISKPHPKSLQRESLTFALLAYDWLLYIADQRSLSAFKQLPRNHRSLKIRTGDFTHADKSTVAKVLHSCVGTHTQSWS
jgi:hypothetical protein